MCLLWHSWYLTHSKQSTQHMLCRGPMKEGVWILCFREGPQWFLTSVFSFFPVGGHCEEPNSWWGQQKCRPSRKDRGLSQLWLWGYFSTKGSYGKLCPWFTNISTMCQSFNSWEWKSVKPGGKFIDIRSYAIRSASVTNDLAKQRLAFPTEHLETKIEPCKELTPSTARERRQGTNPFWRTAWWDQTRWLSKVTGD